MFSKLLQTGLFSISPNHFCTSLGRYKTAFKRRRLINSNYVNLTSLHLCIRALYHLEGSACCYLNHLLKEPRLSISFEVLVIYDIRDFQDVLEDEERISHQNKFYIFAYGKEGL